MMAISEASNAGAVYRRGVFGRRAAALAFVLTLVSFIGQNLSLAADLTAPSLRAWQRSHEGQLTIEWPSAARFHHQRAGDQLLLRFAHPPAGDISSKLRQISSFIALDQSALNGNELRLTLQPGVLSKVRVEGKRLATIDFSRDPRAQPPSNILVSAIDHGVRLVINWAGPTHVQASKGINRLQLNIVPPRELAPGKLSELRRSLKPWLHDLRLDVQDERAVLALMLDSLVTPSVKPSGAAQTIIDLGRIPSSLPAPAAGPRQEVFLPAKKPRLAEVIERERPDRPPIPKERPAWETTSTAPSSSEPQVETIADIAQDKPDALVIDWGKTVAAAIFVRAGHLWTVFDETDASLLNAFPKSPAAFGPGAIVPADGGFAFRFPILEPVDIHVDKTSDGDWRIEPLASNDKLRPLEIEHGDASASLRIMPISGGQIVSIDDPDVGDRLDVLPLNTTGVGQPAQRRFVDLEMLPTAQGVVWRSLNDQLTAEIDGEALIFGTPLGLSLSKLMQTHQGSSDHAVIKAVAKKDPEDTRVDDDNTQRRITETTRRPAKYTKAAALKSAKPSSSFNLAKAGVERELVNEYRRVRRQAITKAAPERRDQARLELARLLVSERLGTEARIILNAISDSAAADVTRQKLALSGVSAFLVGHRAMASDLLLDPELNDDTEIDIWRAALESSENQWQTAADRWRKTSDILDVYPPKLKLDLGLMALETAIETSDDKMIRRGLRRLNALELDAYAQARFDAVRALKAERDGDTEKARSILMALAGSPNRKVRTLADFELAALDAQQGKADIAALAALDRRMPLWRGHPEERSMLDKLARRYRDANALRQALTIWRKLIKLYPDQAESEPLKIARQETFKDALANTNEPALDRVDVYAIYLDFTDLVPEDPEARELHRHLARHLEDLNLLDEAMDVLQPLMASAADDLEQAELANKMATLMLRQERASPAIALLDGMDIQSPELPTPLQEEMLLLRAQALLKMGRADDALRVIRDLQSQPARRLRAEIYWKERSWPRLAAAVEAYFEDVEPAAPLTEDEQELVLWLALARQKGSNTSRLSDLRERFSRSMAEGPYATAFDIATQHSLRSGDIRSLLVATGDQLTELDRFRNTKPESR